MPVRARAPFVGIGPDDVEAAGLHAEVSKLVAVGAPGAGVVNRNSGFTRLEGTVVEVAFEVSSRL